MNGKIESQYIDCIVEIRDWILDGLCIHCICIHTQQQHPTIKFEAWDIHILNTAVGQFGLSVRANIFIF